MKLSDRDIQELKETYPNISEDVIELNSNRKPIQRTVVNVQPVKRRGKYNATPTTFNGVVYHSKKESVFAQKLDLMLKAGEIDYILRQVPFPLGGGVIYRADFMTLTKLTQEHHWNMVVYEVKGMWTPSAKLKMKLFKSIYPNLKLEII
jgi:hypothetical protein